MVENLEFIKDLEGFANSLSEEKRNRLYWLALESYVFGLENVNDINRRVNIDNVEISRRINQEIVRYLEEKCEDDKPCVPKFIYNLL